MAWSEQREGPVLQAFLKLVREYRDSPARTQVPR
jgi:hypothetical protein